MLQQLLLPKELELTEVAPISDLIFDAEDDHRLLVFLLRVSQLLKSKQDSVSFSRT